MKYPQNIKLILILTLIVNINLLHAESNFAKDIKGNYTAQTTSLGEWTNTGNWDQTTAPDPSSDKCDLTFLHNIDYNPTGTSPWLNPFEWKFETSLFIEAGVVVTINSDLDIKNNFSIIIKPGGQFIVNGNVTIKNNVDGVIDGEMYIAGDLTIAGGGNSEFTGTGDIIVDGTIDDPNGVVIPGLISDIERWLIVSDGDWGNNTSWSKTSGGDVAISAPNDQCIVHIENTYTGVLDINTTITELDLQTGGILYVRPGKTLTVSTNVLTDGSLILESDVSGTAGLIYNGTDNVAAKCERYVSANKYHYVSSPMTAAPVSSYNVTSGGYINPNFYYYDETEANADWMYAWRQSTSGNLTPGLGYALYTDENYAYSLEGGVLNNQDFNVTITNTTTAGGSKTWNLIGNPFPCNLDGDAFIEANDDATVFSGSLYFWDDDGTSGTGYSTADYLVYTKGGGTTGGNGGISNGIIAPMQAFFVQAVDATGDLTFSSSAKTESAGTFMKSGISPIIESPLEILHLSLTNKEGLYNDILIKFADDAGDGIDIYDGLKLKGNDNIAFYSILENKHYAIQGFSSDYVEMSVSLGIDANINTEYTIRAEDFVNINKTTKIFIEDKEQGKYVDLRKEDYTFTLFGTDTERFVLHFNAAQDNSSSDIYEKESIFRDIYTNKNIIYINNIEFESIANIYDVTGKLIVSENIQRGNSSLELNVNPGYYIIKLMTENKVNSKKIIIQ